EGIDIRGYGGYVLLPGSLHHTGNTYEFEAGYAPHEIPYIEAPDALQAVLDNAHGNRGRDGRAEVGPSDAQAVNESLDYVRRVLGHGEIDHAPAQAWDGDGRKIVLYDCPFNPEDDPHPPDAASFVVVYQDGRIGAGCHHARCQKAIEQNGNNGWQYLKQRIGFVDPQAQAPVDPELLAEAGRWVASPDAIEALKAAGFKNAEKARKLLDVLVQNATEKQRARITPGYDLLEKKSTISKGLLGTYLARLRDADLIAIYPGQRKPDGTYTPTAFELVFHNLNRSGIRKGEPVQVAKNSHEYCKYRAY